MTKQKRLWRNDVFCSWAVVVFFSFHRGVSLWYYFFFCVANSLGTKIEIPFRFIEEWDGFLMTLMH